MNKLSLFEITQEQIELIEYLESMEGIDSENDEILEAALAINKEEFLSKTADYIAVIRHKEAELERVKLAKKQIADFEKSCNAVIEKLKRPLTNAIKIFGPSTVGFTKLSLRKSDETIITDMAKIPEKFLDKKMMITADKTAIKAAIKKGEEVPGAHLNYKDNLQLK